MRLQHLQALDAAIRELPDDAFSNPRLAGNRKNALHNKLNAVAALLEANDFEEAIEKLIEDIRAKMDASVGGNPRNDWIVDPVAQAQLIKILDNFVATLEKALE